MANLPSVGVGRERRETGREIFRETGAEEWNELIIQDGYANINVCVCERDGYANMNVCVCERVCAVPLLAILVP